MNDLCPYDISHWFWLSGAVDVSGEGRGVIVWVETKYLIIFIPLLIEKDNEPDVMVVKINICKIISFSPASPGGQIRFVKYCSVVSI